MDYKEKVIALLNSQELSKEQKEKLEDIFPELKESDDERIKKEITELVMQPTWKTEKEFHRRKELCAWLEKQGEHANFLNKIQIGDKVTRNEDGVLVNLSQLNRVAKKQDGQKPIFKMKTPEESLGIDSDTYNKIVDECIYGEQKPTDKVKPKFKVGDWLVHKEMVGVTCCIAQIHAPHYYLTINNSFINFGEEDNYRSWTIEDAKDGDVLDFDCGIGIFKNLSTSGYNAHCYCYYDRNGQIETNDYSLYDIYEAEPATKEQRDTLFAKMKEAGYEWDAEHKQLKKMEQKHTPKHKVGDTIYYNSFGELKSMIVANVTTDSTDNPMYEDENGNAVFEKDLVEQKTTWSEEDCDRISSIKYLLHELDNYNFDNWLESLKNKVVPQNKWKPSDEQIEILDMVLTNESMDDNVARILRDIREQLKKLREE